MLEHLFRGCSWVWGTWEGEGEEGCRGEGDLLGYIASGTLANLWVLSTHATVLAVSAARRSARAFLLEEQAEGGEEVGALFNDEAKEAVISRIAKRVPSFTVSYMRAASCITDMGRGACDREDPATNLAADRADWAFLAISNASCLAGEGGGVVPAHDAALGSECVHVACTDEGRGKGPIQVFESED